MKKITQLTFLALLLCTSLAMAQKAVVIGLNHNSSGGNTDGFSFVATEAIPVGEVIYFTENEYSDAANAFVDIAEAVVQFNVTTAMATGDVVFVNETGSNTFTVSCSGGCGTAVRLAGTGGFALSTTGEPFYSFSDNDANITNGVTEIYSVLFTGHAENGTVIGGPIIADFNPVPDFPNAILIDGLPSTPNPDRVEFTPTGAARNASVSKAVLESPSSYVYGQANAALSIIPFTNINLSGSNPTVELSATPASFAENSGGAFTYTLTLSAAATSNVVVNFNVLGSATFGSDYAQSGATSFNTTTGTATIASGGTSTSFTLTPSGDTDLEGDETIIINITGGTGYDPGTVTSSSVSILNDDTRTITPLVAVTGLNHRSVGAIFDAFSFVALDDLTAGDIIYFTEKEFNTQTLRFGNTIEGVLRYTVPGGGLATGTVVVATETGSNTFSLTCNGGSCGSIAAVGTPFSLATNGESFTAYTDTDTDPSNGVMDVFSTLYTGNSGTSGGNIPAIENPAALYIGSVVVDGFPATVPELAQYRPSLRGVTVDQANFQNTSNWDFGQTPAVLSDTPFTNIIIAGGTANPAVTVTVAPASVMEDAGTPLVYTFNISAASV